MKLRPEKRRSLIMKEVEVRGEVDISQLSKKLGVSEMTIRRDLKKLETNEKVLRTYGGAIPVSQNIKLDDTLKCRMDKNEQEKDIIAKYAVEYIEDDSVIMLDASTTSLAICKYIMDKHITVITNSISVLIALANAKRVTVVIVSGMLRRESLSIVGVYVGESFKKFSIKQCFISAKALSYNYGLTDINMFEVESKKAAMSVSNEVVVLLDHTKLNNVSLLEVCNFDAMDKLIVDGLKEFSKEENDLLDKIRSRGVEVIIAK